MRVITEERSEDLAQFHNKIYRQFSKKGISVQEAFNILTLMLCTIAKKTQHPKEEIFSYFESHWDSWEDIEAENIAEE